MAATLSRLVAEAADESLPIYIELPQVQTRRGYLVFKRCFDFLLCTARADRAGRPHGDHRRDHRAGFSGGPIYRQERLRKDGKPFLICKFRSMRTDAERTGKMGRTQRRPLHTLRRSPAQDAAGRAAAALEHSQG